MVKFSLLHKGRISQEFSGNYEQYKKLGIVGHSGIDFMIGWGKPVFGDNDGFIYKIITKEISNEGWQGVYQLVKEDDLNYVEVCMGHFEKILAKKGEYLPEGAVWGLEGNRGYVFSGGTQITPAMQNAGDKRGSHTHNSYRPVKRVKTKSRTEYYLTTEQGVAYRDQDGYYYQIKEKDNGFNGCVNPRNYLVEKSIEEQIGIIQRWINWFRAKK